MSQSLSRVLPSPAMYQKVYLPGSCSTKERQNNLAWTAKMDHILAKTLTEQVKVGNKVDGIWKPGAYTAALQALNEYVGGGLIKEQIKTRLKTWKKQFQILKELLAREGFEWDKEKKMVTADNSAWNNYLKENPNARQFRGRHIEHYDEWCIMMSEIAITTFSDDGVKVNGILTKCKDGGDYVIVLDDHSSDKQAKKIRWTNDMDHSLGKILVEYVNGCKSNSTLQRGLLDFVVSALNEKYGPDLTKEHIKNRLRTWKKQYRILKEVLSHDGFSWDETRKVINANLSVWDDYIKINPEAKSFRGRVFENYDQLCIFFRYYNMEALDFSVAVNDRKTGCEGNSLKWTSEMDHCLRRVLVKHVILGNKSVGDNEFNLVAYDAAILALREMFALEFTKDQVKDRVKSWKSEYRLLRDLLDQGDFKWDGQRKMLLAKDSVWDVSVEEHPDARELQTKSIENYNEMCLIFGNELKTEGWSIGEKHDKDRISNDDAGSDDGFSGADSMETSSQQTGTRPSSSSHSRKSLKRQRNSDAMVQIMSTMAVNVARIADALSDSGRPAYLDQVFDIVQSMPGLEDDLILDACEFFSLDEKRAVMFMKLNDRLRRKWLLKKLRS